MSQIPLLDRDSAAILGNRKMGSMVDMVSQFEVDDLYSQINYQDQPVETFTAALCEARSNGLQTRRKGYRHI